MGLFGSGRDCSEGCDNACPYYDMCEGDPADNPCATCEDGDCYNCEDYGWEINGFKTESTNEKEYRPESKEPITDLYTTMEAAATTMRFFKGSETEKQATELMIKKVKAAIERYYRRIEEEDKPF